MKPGLHTDNSLPLEATISPLSLCKQERQKRQFTVLPVYTETVVRQSLPKPVNCPCVNQAYFPPENLKFSPYNFQKNEIKNLENLKYRRSVAAGNTAPSITTKAVKEPESTHPLAPFICLGC